MIRKEKKNLVEKHTLQFKKSLNQKYIRTPLAPCAEKFQMIYLYFDKTKTSPSVSHAKDWLGQLFLIPGLIWSGKVYHLWMWTLQQRFSCESGLFRHADNQTNDQTTG